MAVVGGSKIIILRVFNMATIFGPDIKPNAKYRAGACCGKDLFNLYEVENQQQANNDDWSVKINKQLSHRIRGRDKTKSFKQNVETLLEYALTNQPRKNSC